MIERFGDSSQLTGELIKGKIIQQPFVAAGNCLRAVSIEFATYCRRNNSTLVLEIYEHSTSLKSVTFKASELSDNQFYLILVDQKVVPGRTYEIKLYSTDGVHGSSVTAKFGTTLHKDMWLRQNGRIQRGELCCILHYGKEEDDHVAVPQQDIQAATIGAQVANKEKPELSIVIPTAKRLDHLKNCIDSIRAHTEDYELIIVVNSPDIGFALQTAKLLSLYPNHFLIRIPYFAGYVLPCNMGAAISRGEFLCILNDDTIVKQDWAAYMLNELKADKKLAQVGPSIAYLAKDFSFTRRPTRRPYIEGWCFVIPRRIYKRFGLFDTEVEFAYCEDSDLSTNLIYHGFKVKEVHANVKHIGSQTSKSSGKEMKLLTDGCERKNKLYLQRKWKEKLRERNV